MAFEIKQDGQESPVAGANPLSQGSAPAAPQTQDQGAGAPQAPSAPATIQSQAQPGTQSKKGPASSGMFTNVQKYVEKNKPQAQKMAKAVTEDFSKQAQGIADVVEKKRTDQATQIGTNLGQMAGQYRQAQGQVADIMGEGYKAPETPSFLQGINPAQTNQQYDFSKLMEGPIGIQQVADLDIGQQSQRAQALARIAQGADREQNRRAMMRDTFGDREYTRGQSALDDLIMGGSKAAREQLIGGTQDAAETLTGQIGYARTQSLGDLQKQRDAMKGFGKQVTFLANDPYKNIKQLAENRATRLGKLDVGSTITADDLAATGLTKDQVANLYGIDPSSYLSGSATADELSKISGLANLLGAEGTHLKEFDTQKFLDDIAAAKTRYETEPYDSAFRQVIDPVYVSGGWGSGSKVARNLEEAMRSSYDAGGEYKPYWNYNPSYYAHRTKLAQEKAMYDQYRDIINAERAPYQYGKGLQVDGISPQQATESKNRK